MAATNFGRGSPADRLVAFMTLELLRASGTAQQATLARVLNALAICQESGAS